MLDPIRLAGYCETPVTVSQAGGSYTGSPFYVDALVNGSAYALEGVYPIILYYVGETASGTASYDAPTAEGTYTAVATFPGSADYNAVVSAPVTFTITPAAS